MIEQSGKIGIFDSGLGGLTILKEIIKLMPEREYLYLGDNLRAPYGNRSQKEIFEFTLAGVKWLFENGAEIAILACNTASANALRKIQQEILPFKYPDKKALGIIIPTVENMENFSQSNHIGILATKATVESTVFEKETKKHNAKIKVVCQSGGKLVSLIEKNKNQNLLLAEIKKVADELIGKDELIDVIILGCTHYPLIEKQIKKVLPKNIKVISQGGIVAEKLADYINRHDEISKKIKKQIRSKFSHYIR